MKQPLNSNANDYFELSLCMYLPFENYLFIFLIIDLKKKNVSNVTPKLCFITMEINF